MSRDAQQKSMPAPVLVAVGRCIEICAGRAEACALAADGVSDRALKELLGESAEQRALEAAVLRSVVAPYAPASTSGTRLRRPRGPRGGSDQSVLEDCIDGELSSLTDFEVTFTWASPVSMPMEVRVLVLSAYVATMRTLSELRRRVDPR